MGLRSKLLLPLLLVGLALEAYLQISWLPHALADDRAAHLRDLDRHLDSVAEGMIPLLLGRQLDIVYENLAALQAKNPEWLSLQLTDASGATLYPLAFPPPPPAAKPTGPDVRLLRKRIAFQDRELGLLSVEVDLGPALANTRQANRELGALIIGVLAILAATLLLATELNVARPIRRLADASRRLARGEFDTPLVPGGKDEVGALVDSFAAMRDDLRSYEVNLLREITERKQSAAELRSVLDTMVEAVLVCNAAGEIVLVNHSGLLLFGFEASEQGRLRTSELPARLQLRAVDGRPLSPDQTSFARALGGETVAAVDELMRLPGSRRDRQISVSAAPIRIDHSVSGAVLVARDTTELRELERIKDQFLEVAAHELKTPVAVMKGFAQTLLRKGTELDDPLRRMLEAINRGADRIDTLVLDLLDVSRLAEGRLELRFEPLDLRELLETAVQQWSLTAPRHRIRVAASAPALVSGDRQRLDQVISNLLSNAVKYSPDLGEIEVGLTVSGGEAVVSVKDLGVGISQESQKHVFERFYRAHTGTPYDHGGMGVGLHISKEIIARHGGRMWFTSQEGKGSTFSFSLPLRR